MSRGEASKAMFWTGIRAGFVYHIALLMFEEAFLVIRWIYQSYFKLSSTPRLEDEKKSTSKSKTSLIVTPSVFTKLSIRNIFVCIAAIFAEGVGTMIGTLFYPGMGSFLGGRLLPLVPYNV